MMDKKKEGPIRILSAMGQNSSVTQLLEVLKEEHPDVVLVDEHSEFMKEAYEEQVYEITRGYGMMEDITYSHLSMKERAAKIIAVRNTPKINRNAKCPCDSGKKYKKCCIKK